MGVLSVIGEPLFVGTAEETQRDYEDWVIAEAGREPDNSVLQRQAAEIRVHRHFQQAEGLKSGLKKLGEEIDGAQRRLEVAQVNPYSGFSSLKR